MPKELPEWPLELVRTVMFRWKVMVPATDWDHAADIGEEMLRRKETPLSSIEFETPDEVEMYHDDIVLV